MFGMVWHELYGLCLRRANQFGVVLTHRVYAYYGEGVSLAIARGNV